MTVVEHVNSVLACFYRLLVGCSDFSCDGHCDEAIACGFIIPSFTPKLISRTLTGYAASRPTESENTSELQNSGSPICASPASQRFVAIATIS